MAWHSQRESEQAVVRGLPGWAWSEEFGGLSRIGLAERVRITLADSDRSGPVATIRKRVFRRSLVCPALKCVAFDRHRWPGRDKPHGLSTSRDFMVFSAAGCDCYALWAQQTGQCGAEACDVTVTLFEGREGCRIVAVLCGRRYHLLQDFVLQETHGNFPS